VREVGKTTKVNQPGPGDKSQKKSDTTERQGLLGKKRTKKPPGSSVLGKKLNTEAKKTRKEQHRRGTSRVWELGGRKKKSPHLPAQRH